MTPVNTPDPHDPDVEHSVLRCYVCETDLTGAGKAEGTGEETKKRKSKKSKKEKDGVQPGLVELRSEGTGFAGGGGNVVQKQGISFQC